MCKLVPILVLLNIWLSTAQCQFGGRCKIEASNGICINLSDCPSQLQGNNSKPCDYNGTESLVCCKLEPGLKIKQKCKEYRLSKNPVGSMDREDTLINEFPHMVALGYEDIGRISWSCGGNLISEQFVLSAAHCAYSRTGPVKFARMGTVNVENPYAGADTQDFEISQIIVHPSFKLPSRYNDIALLQLNRSVTFNSFVRPACLQTDFQISHKQYIATAWGFSEVGSKFSGQLVKVDLVPFSNELCRRIYGFIPQSLLSEGILEESQICAGAEGMQKDTCNADSGGPLQIYGNGSYYVIGVTSFGGQCGLSHVPAIYTRVSKYISWIEDIVWPSP